MTIFRSDGHDLLTAHRLQQDRRVGDVIVVPVLWYNLEIILVVPRLRVEYHHRVGIQIAPFPRSIGEVRGRIASRDVQKAIFDVECVGGPGAGAAGGQAGRHIPGRHVERRLAQRSKHLIARNFGCKKEFPDDFAGFTVERVHMPLTALVVSTRIADVDEAVPGNRRRGHRLAMLRSAILVSHSCLPVLKSKASTRASCVPRNSMPSM